MPLASAAMAKLPDSAKAVIESGRLGHLVTLNADGSPQASLVWFGVVGDEIVTAHLSEHQKVRNVRRDPRVVVTFEADGRGPNGLDHYLVVHGTARIEEGGAPELLQQLARTFLGPDVRFPPMDEPPAGYRTVITVDRVGGNGPWTAGAGPVAGGSS